MSFAPQSFGKCVTLSAFAIALSASTGKAHHPGGGANTGNAGPITTLTASTLARGDSAVGLFFEYSRFDALSGAELTGGGEDEHIHSLDTIQSTSVSYAYGVTDDFTVVVRLPYVKRTGIREAHHEHGEHEHGEVGVLHEGHDEEAPEIEDRGDTEGLGDLLVLGQFRFLDDRARGTELTVIAGLEAPTGETHEKDRNGERFESEFQPGSGSWDGLIGLAATQRFGGWSFDGNVLYTFAGDGTGDTNLGDRFLYNAAMSYRLSGGSPELDGRMNAGAHRHHGRPHAAEPSSSADTTIDLVLELNGEWSQKQVEMGERDDNSGGNVVYVSPGARMGYGQVSGFASVGVPVVTDLNGVQAEPDYRVNTGISVALP